MRYARAYPAELPDSARPAAADTDAGADYRRRAGPGGAAGQRRVPHDRLPHSKLDILDAGHFTWEDAADEYAALVTGWWGGGYGVTGSGAAR
jgi:pimeloyl-ACP methyl ester carboxylesterase